MTPLAPHVLRFHSRAESEVRASWNDKIVMALTRLSLLILLLPVCELVCGLDVKESIRRRLRWHGYSGAAIFEHDPRYDQARQVSNGLCNHRRPLVILRPKSSKDVSAAIRTVAQLKLPLSVRSGGHSYSCGGIKHGSVQLDLRLLDKVQLLPEVYTEKKSGEKYQLARLGPGSRWGRVLHLLPPSRYTYIHGQCTDVGVGGFLLGGGINLLGSTARFGSGSQNVDEYTMVTAAGEVATVTTDAVTYKSDNGTTVSVKNSDLFRALKGAGSSFGVVTEFLYRVYLRPETMPINFLMFVESLHDIKRLELMALHTQYHLGVLRILHFRRVSLAPDNLDIALLAAAAGILGSLTRRGFEPILVTVYDIRAPGARADLGLVLRTFRRFRLKVVLPSERLLSASPVSSYDVNVNNYDDLYLPEKLRREWGPQAIVSANVLVREPRAFAKVFFSHPTLGLRASSVQRSKKASIGCDWCSVIFSALTRSLPGMVPPDLGVNNPGPERPGDNIFYGFDLTCQFSPLRIEDAVKCKKAVEEVADILNKSLRVDKEPYRQYYNTPSCHAGLPPFWERYWGDNYPFLLATKQKWDPQNIFNHCHSVNSTSELCCDV